MSLFGSLRLILVATALTGVASAQQVAVSWPQRIERLEANVRLAEDMSAIKRLQRAYGYYLDKGMWTDLTELFADDAIARYPAGTFIGKESIRRHFHFNVGGVDLGENGLGDNRLYNHMSFQPVVHIDPDGMTARGRWRVWATFGSLGGSATWAEGAYETVYRKDEGDWRIESLTYQSGFSAPYATGWANPGDRPRPARELPHPADEPRNETCGGFPEACIGPFHFENPRDSDSGHAWIVPPLVQAAVPEQGNIPGSMHFVFTSELFRRAAVLRAEQEIENLQRAWGYYYDRRQWDHMADLFADDATIEFGLRGVYRGRERIREFFDTLGPQGLSNGVLNDHVQLQMIVDVDADALTAKSRSREFNMTGEHGGSGAWSQGIYNNTFVREDGTWKFQSVRYYPTFISDYDAGWAEDAQLPPGPSESLPPDLPPTESYSIYPSAYIPPFHFNHPVTRLLPTYPRGAGRPSEAAIAAVRAPVPPAQQIVPGVAADIAGAAAGAANPGDRNAMMVESFERFLDNVEPVAQAIRDQHELENLKNIYGYYIDKNLWNDLADLFAEDGSIELAQRGRYVGRERVREFLFNVLGDEGPVPGRLGNHIQMQPVIHAADDGQTAKMRSRMMQQLTLGSRVAMGAAVYEDEAVREDGIWKFSKVHAYNTWGADYDGGWMRSPSTRVPGPSRSYPPNEPPTLEFSMFPDVYEIPFHYDNAVSGRAGNSAALRETMEARSFDGYMTPEIAAQLRTIGPVIDPPATAAIYSPLHAAEQASAITPVRDIAYGTHERHVLDVWSDASRGNGRPVLVFVHGGGFQRGAKSSEDSPYYDNIARWAAEQGYVGVNINYRLSPEHRWPSGVEDLTAVVDWINANISDFGGDAAKLFLWGNSAGGGHVADYVAEHVRANRDDRIRGAILLSGMYELDDEVSMWEAYYGDDIAEYPRRSSTAMLTQAATPLMVIDAELDPEWALEQAQMLSEALTAADKPFTRLHLAGHSHISPGYAVGTSDRSLTDPIIDFVTTTLSQ